MSKQPIPILNDDFSFSIEDKVIASHRLSDGVLVILNGYGKMRTNMIKQLSQIDVEVLSHEMKSSLITEEYDEVKDSPPVKLPVVNPAKKQPSTVAVKQTRPAPNGSEADGLYERCQSLETQISKVQGRIDGLIAENESLRKRLSNQIPVTQTQEVYQQATSQINHAPTLSPTRQRLANEGPTGSPSMGQKDPIVIEWVKENMTEEQFIELYGHSVIPE